MKGIEQFRGRGLAQHAKALGLITRTDQNSSRAVAYEMTQWMKAVVGAWGQRASSPEPTCGNLRENVPSTLCHLNTWSKFVVVFGDD